MKLTKLIYYWSMYYEPLYIDKTRNHLIMILQIIKRENEKRN